MNGEETGPISTDTPAFLYDVSIIIPHFENLPGLDVCLAALHQQSKAPGRSVEIIVADNNSPSGLARVNDVVNGRARVVVATQKGAGPARNAGIDTAKGRNFAFTDSDCIPDPEWLEAGLAMLGAYDLIGGQMIVLVSSEKSMSGVEAFEKALAFNNAIYVQEKGFTVTANLFCRAQTAALIGPFKTEVSEDLEWCQRGRARGLTIGYAAGAIVGHPARNDWDALLVKWRRINRESYALQIANDNGKLRWLAKTWLLPLSILPHGLKIMRSSKISGMGNRTRALGTLIAHRLWRLWDQQKLMLENDKRA